MLQRLHAHRCQKARPGCELAGCSYNRSNLAPMVKPQSTVAGTDAGSQVIHMHRQPEMPELDLPRLAPRKHPACCTHEVTTPLPHSSSNSHYHTSLLLQGCRLLSQAVEQSSSYTARAINHAAAAAAMAAGGRPTVDYSTAHTAKSGAGMQNLVSTNMPAQRPTLTKEHQRQQVLLLYSVGTYMAECFKVKLCVAPTAETCKCTAHPLCAASTACFTHQQHAWL
jgi:hypothetical protein